MRVLQVAALVLLVVVVVLLTQWQSAAHATTVDGPPAATSTTAHAPTAVVASQPTGSPRQPGEADAGATAPQFGFPDPFKHLGSVISQAAADAWTAAMLALWSAGLLVLKVVLAFADSFLSPDLSESGPGRRVYGFTFWIASSLVVVLALIQLGVGAVRRDGRGLARVATGAAQFVIVWSCWLGYCVTVLTACTSLTKALMAALLDADSWADWSPMGNVDVGDVTNATVATVLGLLGCVLWLAALGHLLVMLARAASLIVLVATGPIASAGLVSDTTRSWFWKSLRWFHAAAFTPVIVVLVLGIGVQLSSGVADGLAGDSQKAIGTALPSVMLICISAVAPLALFKLLAFVDPGTPSGAAFRQGMVMQGGVQGLLGGRSADSPQSGATVASTSDDNGRADGESTAETSTGARFASVGGASSAGSGSAGAGGLSGVISSVGSIAGGAGKAVAGGLAALQGAGAAGASLIADQSNQSGVGHQTYGPDFGSLRAQDRANRSQPGQTQRHPFDELQPGGGPPGATPAAGGAGGAGAATGSGGAAAGAAAIPPVAV